MILNGHFHSPPITLTLRRANRLVLRIRRRTPYREPRPYRPSLGRPPSLPTVIARRDRGEKNFNSQEV
jgi:hypothetical protein